MRELIAARGTRALSALGGYIFSAVLQAGGKLQFALTRRLALISVLAQPGPHPTWRASSATARGRKLAGLPRAAHDMVRRFRL